jgi:ribosomal protein RSM22 (predicted rRNA methylase)
MFFAGEEIEFPSDLAAALESALWGEGGDKLISRRAQALNQLWEKLAKRRGMIEEGEQHYSFRRDEADAYAAYYLPANALKPAILLEEAYLLGQDLMPSGNAKWLDCGTGPGTAYWGAAWWAERRQKDLQFFGWDQSPVFAEIAGNLARQGKMRAPGRFHASKKEDLVSFVRKHNITHVSFMNSVAEIFHDPGKRLEEIKKLWGALSGMSQKDGQERFLFLIEPGSRDSSRELAELKDAMPIKPFLPCLDARPCGALVRPHDWCHEEVGVSFPSFVNELGAQAGLRKESLLFSYAIFSTSPHDSLAGRGRVVSQRLERKGQTECFLCTPEGKVAVRAQLSKAGPESAPVIEARRGDIWKDAVIGPKKDLEKAERFIPAQPSLF